MFTKTTLAAAAYATAISAGTATLPSAAYASHNLDFSITIDLGNGTLSFGDGGFNPGPMSCWDAKQHLKDDFKHVQDRDQKQTPKQKNDDFPTLMKYWANWSPTFRQLHDGDPVIRTRQRRRA